MRRVLALGLVALVIATAGCSGVFGGGSGAKKAPGNPAGSTGTPMGDRLAPGVSEGGIHNTSALLAAHRSTLATEGFVYTFKHRLVERDYYKEAGERAPEPNVTTAFVMTGTVRATAELETHLRRTTRRLDGPGPKASGEFDTVERTGRYADADGGTKRIVSGNTTYENYTGDPDRGLATPTLFGAMIKAANWTVASVENGGDRIVLKATGPSPAARKDPEFSLSEFSYSGRIVVTSEGVIRSFRGNLTMPMGFVDYETDETVRVGSRSRIMVYEVKKVGNVTVEEPSWAERTGTTTSE